LLGLSYLPLPSRVLPSSFIYIMYGSLYTSCERTSFIITVEETSSRSPRFYFGRKKITACKDLNESGQLINSAFSSNKGLSGILRSCLPYNINPRYSSRSFYLVFIVIALKPFSKTTSFFSPSFCFIIIIVVEHDGDDDNDNNEGIHKPRGRETTISSVRLPRACVRVLRGRAGDE